MGARARADGEQFVANKEEHVCQIFGVTGRVSRSEPLSPCLARVFRADQGAEIVLWVTSAERPWPPPDRKSTAV